ncbi:copper amine oxidase N-terminal domain-containing protein [Paenibacillus sp. NPDC057934]|uniref:copper amine oxidase N-terminal domain-containing protein n=1 Tax=Paenibacillus sp. NPDC057934 TaxID=3346282 RepID=UPI0036DB8713
MRKIKSRALWFMPFIALVLVLAGCQSVGGFDVNKALLGDLDVKSSEYSTKLSLAAVPSSDKLSAEDQQIVDLINSLSLNVSNLKLQDNGDISAKGTVGYKKLNLPFAFFMDKEAIVLNVEGAKQPFYFPITSYEKELGVTGLDPAKAEDLSKLITQFVVKNLPNPGVINVSNVSEAVYGEQLNLTKLHAEVTGQELPALLKTFLKSISKDTEGFTNLISGLYDYLYPIIKASGVNADDYLNLGLGDLPLDDKEGVVTVLHDAAKLAVDSLLLVYDKELDNLYEYEPELKTVLSKDTKLQVDLYVDSSLHIRKQNVDLKIALPQVDGIPLKSISLKAESQAWNIGGKVTADHLSTDGALDVTKVQLTPGETLRSFEPGSDVYRLLKDEIGITKKSLVIGPDDDYYYPVVINNTTYVPLRYLAQDLDATIKWDGATRTITVTDDLQGDQLVFKVGSAQATLNGLKINLGKAVFIDEYGDANVPLRVLAEALHGKVTRDEEGWIYINRD